MSAREANDLLAGPVELKNLVRACAGRLMQAVDILGNQSPQSAAALQFDNRLVPRIRPRFLIFFKQGELALPVQFSLFFVGEKFLNGHRLKPLPDAALGPVVADAAFRRNPGAGEDDNVS